jgi:hypothetical protein
MTPSRSQFGVRLVSVAFLLAAACFSKKPVPCAQDGTCADGLACRNHTCSQAVTLDRCQTGTDCSVAGPNQACLRLHDARGEDAICTRRCAVDADCATGQFCSPGAALDGTSQFGCLPGCQLGVTSCSSTVLQCRDVSGGPAVCSPGAPPTPTWALFTGAFESSEAGASAGPWQVVAGGFEGGETICNQPGGTCVAGGFTE